ncbi:aminoglycoside phosphotransferase family protein [Lentzea sp. BCCO 10_0856]|uniref:Aminoglycoside phosphotransferase family protein n=1 Tax=Lentzea miocenica TaxID=3095431 RepID=A0ABU4SW61_9PSEU|nr:aminoglycoside phosphotransferase family protein [Lentzea sp. BCCO 10_0856]MDX8030136.1 aminoglycoside phosphotransferase family protein [Lentzea sp. BCCO 10_0856]
MTYLGEGWDSTAELVDGWVVRRPRRPEIGPQLLREAAVMPWLAPRLPLPVPVPEVVSEEPVVVRHALVPGELASLTAVQGRQLGEFLRALHAVPVAEAAERGVGPMPLPIDRFRAEVRVPGGDALLAKIGGLPADTLVHGDLGPEHVLGRDGVLTGVIDFGDLHVGDAAIDLAWALNSTPPVFAQALASAYGVTDELRERALIWHQLGPWHEVLYGNDIGDAVVAADGLNGVLERLRTG